MFQTELKELEEKEFYTRNNKYVCTYFLYVCTTQEKQYLQKNPLMTILIFNINYYQ